MQTQEVGLELCYSGLLTVHFRLLRDVSWAWNNIASSVSRLHMISVLSACGYVMTPASRHRTSSNCLLAINRLQCAAINCFHFSPPPIRLRMIESVCWYTVPARLQAIITDWPRIFRLLPGMVQSYTVLFDPLDWLQSSTTPCISSFGHRQRILTSRLRWQCASYRQ